MIIILNQYDLAQGRKATDGVTPHIQDFKAVSMQQINHAEIILYDTGDSLKVLKSRRPFEDNQTKLQHIAAKRWSQ